MNLRADGAHRPGILATVLLTALTAAGGLPGTASAAAGPGPERRHPVARAIGAPAAIRIPEDVGLRVPAASPPRNPVAAAGIAGLLQPMPADPVRLAAAGAEPGAPAGDKPGAPVGDKPGAPAGDKPDTATTTGGAAAPPAAVDHRGEVTPDPAEARDVEKQDQARQAREAADEASREPARIAAQATAALERLILDGRYSRDNEFVIGAALSAGPSYSGASDWGYSLSPAARLTWRGYSISTQSVARATARVEQTGRGERTGISGPLRVRNRFAYGFGLSINRGRDVTEEGAALGLKSLPSTLYGRLRLRYVIDEQTTLSATLISDLLNRQQNLELPIGISRRYVLAERMVVAFDAALNIVNRRSMDNDYGIGPQQSAASGLPVYSPSAGLREFAVSATLVHEPDNHWVWMTRFSLVRLVGEAAASPLVKQKLQPNLMFGLAYRFTWD
jgi:outer membrane scaffolding protein for murein synthesis (MipA/OmpV family)